MVHTVADKLVAWTVPPFANPITSASGVGFAMIRIATQRRAISIRLLECVQTVRSGENCNGCRQEQ